MHGRYQFLFRHLSHGNEANAASMPRPAGGQPTEEDHMPNEDEVEGRVKEAAGDLTGNKDLQREGKLDQASGKAKQAIDDAADKAKDAVDRD
jgi:uncharacterized protein YjbJ (UPF0337 family)